MSALRHLQRCEIGGGFIILQINAVFERLYTRSSHSRRFPEKSGLGLTNEQTGVGARSNLRSEEHTSELQSLMRISYAVFSLKKKHISQTITYNQTKTTKRNTV